MLSPNSVLELLDVPHELDESSADAWATRMADSLSGHGPEWLVAVERSAALSEDRAWALLSWVELSANMVSRNRDGRQLEVSVFAVSLMENTGMDRRDRAVVVALLRRAAASGGLDFVSDATAGCRRAGELGASCLNWILNVSDATPETHEEVWSGGVLAFVRKPAGFDASDLAGWLENDGIDDQPTAPAAWTDWIASVERIKPGGAASTCWNRSSAP